MNLRVRELQNFTSGRRIPIISSNSLIFLMSKMKPRG